MSPHAPRIPRDLTSDLLAGFVVALVALPLCLAIALASGFPPFAGVLTAIVGGLVPSLLGSAPLTIKGPAAGLIVIVLGSVETLGAGTAELGVRRTAALVAIAGCVQIALGLTRAGKVAELVPAAVVHGMLAAIGVLLVAKQGHVLLGVKPAAHTPAALLAELPKSLLHARPVSVVIGVAVLAAMVAWTRFARNRLARIPPAIVGLAVALLLGEAFDLAHPRDLVIAGVLPSPIRPDDLVRVPAHLHELVAAPSFEGLASAAGARALVLLVVVGTLETLLSAKAIDNIDPLHRRTDLDRDLVSVGVGNTLAGLLGGLPMISEIVRSSANVAAGGRTARANVVHGLALLAFVAVVPDLVHRLPVAALAALLVLKGLQLASPRGLLHARAIGLDQAAVFSATIVCTVAVDLLVGIAAGIALEAVVHCVRGLRFQDFRPCRFDTSEQGSTRVVTVQSPALFVNALALRQRLLDTPDDRALVLDLRHARYVDHSVLSMVDAVRRSRQSRSVAPLEVVGLDAYANPDAHPLSTRRTPRAPAAMPIDS
jgi:MFS superfamily sulfate permease-like transporter